MPWVEKEARHQRVVAASLRPRLHLQQHRVHSLRGARNPQPKAGVSAEVCGRLQPWRTQQAAFKHSAGAAATTSYAVRRSITTRAHRMVSAIPTDTPDDLISYSWRIESLSTGSTAVLRRAILRSEQKTKIRTREKQRIVASALSVLRLYGCAPICASVARGTHTVRGALGKRRQW